MVNREEIIKKINDETFSIKDIPDFMENAVEIANSSEDVAEEIEGMNKKFQFDLGGTADFWLKIAKKQGQRIGVDLGVGFIRNDSVTIRQKHFLQHP